MHLKDSLINFICDQDYYIAVYYKHIYIYQYKTIDTIDATHANFSFEKFKLKIKGEKFFIERMLKNEILIGGLIKEFKIEYE